MKGSSLQSSNSWLLSALENLESILTSESQSEEPLQLVQRGLKRIRASVQQKVKRDLVQQVLIAKFGGNCKRCLGNFHPNIYDFHHVDPNEKEFNMDRSNFNRRLETIMREALKCVLLCANCHREVHTFMDKRFLKTYDQLPEGRDVLASKGY